MREAILIFVAAVILALCFVHGGPNTVCSQVTKGSIVAVLNCPTRFHDMAWSF